MTARTEQQPMHPLATVLGGVNLHGKALDDAALLGLAAADIRHMCPADEMDNLAGHLHLHARHQGLLHDHRFGKRHRIAVDLAIVAHERPRSQSVKGERHDPVTIGLGESITGVPLLANNYAGLTVATATAKVAIDTFSPNSVAA